jgi:hypothetical protein
MKDLRFTLSLARHPILAAAAGIAILQMAAAEEAAAQTSSGQNIGAVAQNIIGQIGSVGKVALGGAFCLGIVMMAAGLIKLKQAADTQGQQVKYGEGLWRLAAGTGLVAIPSIAAVLGSTFSLTPGSISSATGGATF